MDPLSIAMAILTVIGAAKTAIKAAQSLHDVPEELESLHNDLTDAELMIRDIKSYVGEHDGNSPQEIVLQERLVEAEGVVMELKALVVQFVGSPGEVSSLRRYKWFKAKKKTRKLSKKLARIHEDLPRRHGHAAEARIRLDLMSISNVQMETTSGLSRLEERLDTTSESVSRLEDSLLTSQKVQCRTIYSLEDLRRDTTQRLDNIESMISNNNNILQALPAIMGLQMQTILQSSTSTTTSIHELTGSDEKASGTTTSITTSTVRSTYQSIMIQSQYRPPNTCEVACQCQCHTSKSLTTPSGLSSLVGRLYLGYKGIPVVSTPCDDAQCKRNSQQRVYLSYFFPKWWIMNRMMIILAQYSTARGLELILRFPRRVSFNAPVFNYAENGNIEGLKSLFYSGKASPNDVDGHNKNVLLYAFDVAKSPDTCRFLIQAGADPETEDAFGRKIGDHMWRSVFSGRRTAAWEQWITSTFVSAKSQGFGFSSLHEVVLRLRYSSLDEEISRLSSCPGALDIQDTWGYTPLLWACIRNDFEAVRQLVERGANLEMYNENEETPLLVSARGGSLECAMYLLDHGADPRACSENGWTALHYICAYQQPMLSKVGEFLDKLYDNGIDINARSRSGGRETPLFLSFQSADLHGNITLKWLLDRGADYTTTFSAGGGILHELGRYGNMESVQIMQEAQIYGLDIHAKFLDSGETPMDLMLDPNREEPASEKHVEAFRELLAEIEARTQGGPVPLSEKSERESIIESKGSSSSIFEMSSSDSSDEGTVSFFDDSDEGESEWEDSVEFQVPESV